MREPFRLSVAEVMRLSWLQVEKLYLVPTSIQNKLERDAINGQSGVSESGFKNAYREMKPDETEEQVERAWIGFSRGM